MIDNRRTSIVMASKLKNYRFMTFPRPKTCLQTGLKRGVFCRPSTPPMRASSSTPQIERNSARSTRSSHFAASKRRPSTSPLYYLVPSRAIDTFVNEVRLNSRVFANKIDDNDLAFEQVSPPAKMQINRTWLDFIWIQKRSIRFALI